MKCRRIVGFLVGLSLAMSGSMLGSEPVKFLRVRESDLGDLIQSKRVALHLIEGGRIEGRVREVTSDKLFVKVKKSSQPAAYPKGKIQIARADVVGIEVRDLFVDEKLAAKRKKQTARTVATSLGAGLGGGLLTLYLLGYDKGTGAVIGGSFGVGAIVAVLTNLLPRPKDITFIETVPDFPMERESKPSDNHPGAGPTVSEETPDLSLIEPSVPEQIRLQARRALMRKGLPLNLSRLPIHDAQTD